MLLKQKWFVSLSSIEIRMNEPTAPALSRGTRTRNHTRGAAVRKIHGEKTVGENAQKGTVTRTRGRVGRDDGRYREYLIDLDE